MTNKDLFENLRQPKMSDRILLLTHTDMDGAGPVILLKSIFPNVDVKHCSNGRMSFEIKNAVMNDELNQQYDMFIACDISCNEHDAEVIDASKNKNKLVILDHHLTADYLNKYSWACITSQMTEDSFRIDLESDACLQSGSSLMYDYLDFCGYINDNISNIDFCQNLINNIALYDTWDWVNMYNKSSMTPHDLATLFEIYGTDLFEENMIARISDVTVDTLLTDTDELLLTIEKNKIKHHIDKLDKIVNTGNMLLNNKYYGIAFCYTGDYLNETFEYMKDTYPDYDLYLINYGTGVSLRATKPDINVGLIVKELGGGGHAGAGGVKIKFDNQVEYLANALSATIYVDEKED